MCRACGIRHNSLVKSGSSGGSGDDGSIGSTASYNAGWADGSTATTATGRSMKECETQLAALQKENFALKCRVYLMEKSGVEQGAAGARLDMEVENETLRASLLQKQELLQQASAAFAQLEQAYRQQLQEQQVAQMQQLQEAHQQLHQLQQTLADYEERCRVLESKETAGDMNMLAGLAFPDFGEDSRQGSLAPSVETTTSTGSHHYTHQSHHTTTTPPVHINASNVTYNTISNTVATPPQHQPSTTHHHYQPNDATSVVPINQEAYQQLHTQLAALQAQLHSERAEKKLQEDTITTLSSELEKVQPAISVKIQELEDRDAIIEQKSEQLQQQNKILVEIQITLDERQRAITELEGSVEGARREVSDLSCSLETSRREVSGLVISLEAARRQICELEAGQREAESIREQVKTLESSLESTEAKAAQLQTDYDKSCGCLTGVVTELTAVKAQNTRLSRKNTELLKELRETVAMLEEGAGGLLEEENERLWAELESLKKEVGSGRGQHAENSAHDLRLCRERLAVCESSLETKTTEVASLARELQAARGSAREASEAHAQRMAQALSEVLDPRQTRMSVPVSVCVSADNTEDNMSIKEDNISLSRKANLKVSNICCNCQQVCTSKDSLLQLGKQLESSKDLLVSEWQKEQMCSEKDTARLLRCLHECQKVRDTLKTRLEDMSSVLEQILDRAEDIDLSKVSGLDISCLQDTLNQSRLLSHTLDASELELELTFGNISLDVTGDVSITRVDVEDVVERFYGELRRSIDAIIAMTGKESDVWMPEVRSKNVESPVKTIDNEEVSTMDTQTYEVSCQTSVEMSTRPGPPSLGQMSAARLSSLLSSFREHNCELLSSSEAKSEELISSSDMNVESRDTVSYLHSRHEDTVSHMRHEDTRGHMLPRDTNASESECYSEPDLKVSLARMGRLSTPLSGSSESEARSSVRRVRCDGRCRMAGRLRATEEVVAALKAEVAVMAGEPMADRVLCELRCLRSRLEQSVATHDEARRQLEAAVGAGRGDQWGGLCLALLSAQDTAQVLREKLSLAEHCEQVSRRDTFESMAKREESGVMEESLDKSDQEESVDNSEQEESLQKSVQEESSFLRHEEQFAAVETLRGELTAAVSQIQSLDAALTDSETQVLRVNRDKLSMLREKDRLRSGLLSAQTQTTLLCRLLGVQTDDVSTVSSPSSPPSSPSRSPRSPHTSSFPDLQVQLLGVQTAVKELQREKSELEFNKAFQGVDLNQPKRSDQAFNELQRNFDDLHQKYNLLTQENVLGREAMTEAIKAKQTNLEDTVAKFERDIAVLKLTIKELEINHCEKLELCQEKEMRLVKELNVCQEREESFKERLASLEEQSVVECQRLEERVRELGERRLSMCDSCLGRDDKENLPQDSSSDRGLENLAQDSSSDRGLGSSVERLPSRSSGGCHVLEHRILATENGRLAEELQHTRASLTAARGALTKERGAKKSADKLICKELLKTYKVLDNTGKRTKSTDMEAGKSQEVLTTHNKLEAVRRNIGSSRSTGRLSSTRTSSNETKSAQRD